MKIYTRTGDHGTTSLYSGERVPKHDPRMHVCGTIDELNSLLGLASASSPTPQAARTIHTLQHLLFRLGADFATSPDSRDIARITPADIAALEALIDTMTESLPKKTAFVLPGGSPAGATLHVARTVCRRAERLAFSLADSHPVNPHACQFLNRLSDLLFTLACFENHLSHAEETPWTPSPQAPRQTQNKTPKAEDTQ